MGGILGLVLLLATPLSAQERDPFVQKEGDSDPFADLSVQSLSSKSESFDPPLPEAFEGDSMLGLALMAEFVEVDLKQLPGLLIAHGGKADSTALYEQLQDEKARSVEVVYGRFPIGSRGKVESVDEVIYATEYDPPEIPSTVRLGEGTDESLIPRTPAVPAAFETRNVGTMIEADTTVEDGGQHIQLSLAGQSVNYLGRDYHLSDEAAENGQGVEVIWMPRFHSMSVNTKVVIKSGSIVLVGTFHPPAEVAEEGKRWLLFIHGEVIRSSAAEEPRKGGKK